MNSGGKTICVLGCGLDFPYLTSKIDLKQKIIQTGGAVISEYPPGTPATAWHFPARNRIISGLSHGTVVVEAGRKSGSLITANLANEQNRDVFVVAPRHEDFSLTGNVSLINDGAQAVESGDEILKEYSSRPIISSDAMFSPRVTSKKRYEFNLDYGNNRVSSNHPESKKIEAVKLDPRAENLSEYERKVYEVISKGRVQVNDIVEKTGIPSYKILGALTTLELLGIIKSLPGKYYEII